MSLEAIQGSLDRLLQLAGAAAPLVDALRPVDALAMLLVFMVSTASARLSMWLYCLLVLPGTLMHELMHWGVAIILRASPSLPSLIPKREGSYWRLGSVSFHAGPIRSVPIALAPLALIPMSLTFANTYLPMQALGLAHGLLAWVSTTALMAGFPSRQDWRIAAPALLVLAAGLLLWSVS